MNYKLFIYFLRKNNVLDKYMKNFTSYNNTKLNVWCERNNYTRYLTRSFGWNTSKERRHFWEKINNDWLVFIENLPLHVKFKIKK